jgi:small-conductance mechanosensitive channel
MDTGVVLAAASTPGVGPDELIDYWPLVYRAGWGLVSLLVVLALGWFLVEPAVSEIVRHRNRNNPTIRDVVTRYVRLVVVVVSLLVAVAASGYGYIIGDSIIVIAAATLAVGVAGQTVLGSLVSGLVLVMDPEFNVGNFIEWDGGRGRVQSITLRTTRLITPGGEMITVPNTALTEGTIKRPYGRVRYRLVDRIGVDYDDDVEAAMALIERVAEAHPDVADEPSPKAFVEEFLGDWVTLRIHYWIPDPERQEELRVRSTFSTSLKAELEDAGFTISPASKRDLQGEVAVEAARE